MANEILTDFRDVVLREAVSFGNLTRGDESPGMEGDVDEGAVEKVGVGIQLHKEAITLPVLEVR